MTTHGADSRDGSGSPLDYGSADDIDGHVGERPAYELVENSPPPPDDKVIALEEARQQSRQRSWLLCAFIGALILVVVSDIALSAALPDAAWLRLKPEIDYLRNSIFTILLVIIGFYFGEKKR
jgi:hypothetical protein